MIKKDYIIIAKGIERALPLPESETIKPIKYKRDFETVSNTAKWIADELKRDNPLFNRDTFLRACKIYK